MDDGAVEDYARRAAAEVERDKASKKSSSAAAPFRTPFSPAAAPPPSSPSSPPSPRRNHFNLDNRKSPSRSNSASSPGGKASFVRVLELENEKRKRDSMSRKGSGGDKTRGDEPSANDDDVSGGANDAPRPLQSRSESSGGDYEAFLEICRGPGPGGRPKSAETKPPGVERVDHLALESERVETSISGGEERGVPVRPPKSAETKPGVGRVDPPLMSVTQQVEPSMAGVEEIVKSASEWGEDKPDDPSEHSEADAEAGQSDVHMSATKQIGPTVPRREGDISQSTSETVVGTAGNLAADVYANAPTDSQMTDSKEEPVYSTDSSFSQTIEDDNGGKDEKSSVGKQTLEAGEPQAAVGARVDSSSLPTDQIKSSVLQTKEAHLLLDQEILFDDSVINIPAFDDGSLEARRKVQGWTNSKWIAAADKALRFTAPVLRVAPGRFFWSSDVFKNRIMAIYDLGSVDEAVILILRLPTDRDEVRRLLPIRGGLELSEQELHSFLVVETAADPRTCKLQLSQLTQPASIPTKGNRTGSPSKRSTPRGRSCFNILTPTEVVTLSAAFLPDESFEDIENISEKSLDDTLRCEDAIVSALTSAHSSGNSLDDEADQVVWKHTVVLGTLHSYVILGHDQRLKESLENVLHNHNSCCKDENESDGVNRMVSTAKTAAGILDCTVIDARDDGGKTALHYACTRRRSSTIQILVGAGADCSIPQTIDELTPCHICAKGLDEKGLSIVLSARYPTRPNPNALDCHGRTPMYLAAVEGMSHEGGGNAIALDLCLSALEAWGGQLTLNSPKCQELLHPVHCVSAQWKSEELSTVLSHCNYHYPLTSIDGSNPGSSSLSAIFHYPIHAALVSLRRRIISAFDERAGNEFNAEFMPVEPALVKTLRTLLEHGFEPNERLEGIIGNGEAKKAFSSYFGTNPLQILALAAVEAKALDLKKRDLGEDDVESVRILENIMKVIRSSAELLLKNGARINVQPPPRKRLDRDTPAGCYSLKEALEVQNVSSMPGGYREGLKLDGSDEVLALLGDASRVSTCQNAFALLGKTVEVSGTFTVGSSPLNSDAPGGSDSNSCAICWSEFGIISNRKHLCRVSRRNVCNDCSAKRLVKNGSEHRVSDGQFLLGRAEAKKEEVKLQAGREEKMRKQRQSVTQSRKSLGLRSTSGSASSTDGQAKQTQLSRKERIANAMSGLGQTRNAVIERGDKLESLADKTEALNNASLDFANMAKELNRSQNSWW